MGSLLIAKQVKTTTKPQMGSIGLETQQVLSIMLEFNIFK